MGGPHECLGTDVPARRRGRDERVHETARVHRLPSCERRQQPDADVHGAVADREHPSVPGEVVALAVAEVEVALDPGVVVVRALEVAPHGHAHRVRPVARRPERPAEPRVRAVGDDEVARPDRFARAALLAVDDRARDETALDERIGGFRRGPHGGARLHRLARDHLVEVAPADDVAVRGKVRVVGPGELEGDAVRDRPEAVVALVVGERVGEPHVVELAHRPGGQPVPARLLAWEALLLDDEHPPALLGEPVRRRRARRSSADDEHVVAIRHGSPAASAPRHFRMVSQRARTGRTLPLSPSQAPAHAHVHKAACPMPNVPTPPLAW